MTRTHIGLIAEEKWGVAQVGERMNGFLRVRGFDPPRPTKNLTNVSINFGCLFVLAFRFCVTLFELVVTETVGVGVPLGARLWFRHRRRGSPEGTGTW